MFGWLKSIGSRESSYQLDKVDSFEEIKKQISEPDFKRLEVLWGHRDYMSIDELFNEILCHPRIPYETRKLINERFCENKGRLGFKSFVTALVALTETNPNSKKGLLSTSNQKFRPLSEDEPQNHDILHDAHMSFYHILAGVTHLEEIEIAELETFFEDIVDQKTLKLTQETFNRLTDGVIPDSIQDGFFRAFDENKDGLIDFKEFVCGLSASCRGPDNARLKFLAQIWDTNHDGHLEKDDVEKIYDDLKVAEHERNFSIPEEGKATLIDFVCWASSNDCVKNSLLSIAQRIGYVCLGLNPTSSKIQLEVLCDVKEHVLLKHLQMWQVVPASLWSDVIVALNCIPPLTTNIDYSELLATNTKNTWASKHPPISSDCLILKEKLAEKKDYELIPPNLWEAVLRWLDVQNPPQSILRRALSRSYFPSGKIPSSWNLSEPSNEHFIELYPPVLLFLRHSTPTGWLQHAIGNLNPGALKRSPWKYLTITRATTVGELRENFAKSLKITDLDAIRFWGLEIDGKPTRVILTDDAETLHGLGIVASAQILLEIRNQDMSWPEELIRLRSSSDSLFEGTEYGAQIGKRVNGVTGLCNLGNTCYMNAAIQCLSNVQPLTDYFIKELNINGVKNGSKVAPQYKALMNEIWVGKKTCLIPSKFKETMAQASEIFLGRAQHDCQEFLSILLDLLHNDLNEIKSSEPYKIRENGEDHEIADEAWNAYLGREKSVIVDLFHGQLKSSLECLNCHVISSRFDPFSCIQLQIPIEQLTLITITVFKKDGSIPYRYSLRVPSVTTINEIKAKIQEKCGVPKEKFVFLCLDSSNLRIKMEYTINMNDPTYEVGSLNLVGTIQFAYEVDQSLESSNMPNYFLSNPLRLAVHRRMVYNHLYALKDADGCTPLLFGIPVLLEFKNAETTSKEIYENVWKQVERLVDTKNSNQASSPTANRAIDANEDIRSGYPFELSIVDQTFDWCGVCEWQNLCRGCPIKPSDEPLTFPELEKVVPNFAIHWKPASFHLRYQQSLALACIDDPSVTSCHDAHYSPTTLASCFEDFVRPELLDEAFKCEKCEEVSKKEKSLSLWRLPKILIVHFKRFVYLPRVNRWAKSTKIIDFPLENFDPSPYFASNANPDGSTKYECVAIACHEGSMMEGHYIAYAKNSGQWFRFNDSHCQPLKDTQVNKNNAYIVFYQRVD